MADMKVIDAMVKEMFLQEQAYIEARRPEFIKKWMADVSAKRATEHAGRRWIVPIIYEDKNNG